MRSLGRLEGKVPHPLEKKGPKFKQIEQFYGGMTIAGDERKEGRAEKQEGGGKERGQWQGEPAFCAALPVCHLQHWHTWAR